MINNDRSDPFDGVPVFVRVADTLSFRAAAQALGITPAAVSRSVQRLEERMGVRLFERTTRSVRLTAEGAGFAVRCREAMAQVTIGACEIAESRAAPTGTLVVSASPILERLVVPRLGKVLGRYPRLRVDLRFTDRMVRFTEDDVEVALRVGPPNDPSVVAHVLARPRWSTVAAPAYVARHGAPRSVADLASHRCLRYAPPRGRARPWFFGGEEVAVTSRLDVDHGDVLVDAALDGVGIAQVLDFMVADHLAADRLIELLPDLASPGPTIHAVHPRRPLPRVKAFVDVLREDLRLAG